jgi:hypothetical protein
MIELSRYVFETLRKD